MDQPARILLRRRPHRYAPAMTGHAGWHGHPRIRVRRCTRDEPRTTWGSRSGVTSPRWATGLSRGRFVDGGRVSRSAEPGPERARRGSHGAGLLVVVLGCALC
jgi:hypothetical protein